MLVSNPKSFFEKSETKSLDLKFKFWNFFLTKRKKEIDTVYYLLFCARPVLVHSESRISLLFCSDLPVMVRKWKW